MTNAEMKARALIKKQSMEKIIEQYELTEKMEMSLELARVRGWLADEMEERNPEAYDRWLDYMDIDFNAGPREFFL